MNGSPPVTIVDAGSGNLRSVARAVEHVGGTPIVSQDPAIIARAERLILPGVGAFGHVMTEIRNRRLDAGIIEFADTQRPFLGICVGMQAMMSESEEFGQHRGFGFVSGKVQAIGRHGANGMAHKIPHIGWAGLTFSDQSAGRRYLFKNVREGASVYFVHSFAAQPDRVEDLAATCRYDGLQLSAAINRGALWGCQFHPEKSGEVGMKILRNFIQNL